MAEASTAVKPEKFVVPGEWRSRCEVLRLTPENKAEFFPLHADFLKSLLTIESLDFILYIAVGWEMFEFIRPKDFSIELVKEMLSAHKQYPAQTRICVKRADYERYERIVTKYRREKFTAAAPGTILVMEGAYRLYAELSSVSQLLVRGFIDEESYNRIARAASQTVMQMCSTKDVVQFLVNVVGREPALYDHAAVTAIISASMAWNVLKLQKRESKLAVQAALLHDVERNCVYFGKPATANQISLQAIKDITALKAAGVGFHDSSIEVMQQYRERFDGAGFPKRLKGAAEGKDALMGISRMARMVSIGCAFSEYMLKRQDKQPLSLQAILKFMTARADSGELDAELVKQFVADTTTGTIRKPKESEKSDDYAEEE